MRSPTRTRLTFATLFCAGALALAACGTATDAPPLAGNTQSTSVSASPSPSASSTPTATPTRTASATPTPTATKGGGDTVTKGGPAKGKSAEAAKKVAQAFVAADNAATRTGSFTARDKITGPSCAWCATKRSFVAKIYTGGGHIEGELFTKNTFTVTGPSRGVFTVVVNTTVSRYKEIDGAGKVTDSRGDRDGLLVLQVGGSKVVGASWQPTS
jgi:hypothetical protein